MKKLLAVLLVAFFLSASAQEMNYYNKSWAEIKETAKAEHKYIMVDGFTEWCGWCKVMDKETMIDPKTVEFVNKNFIPVKMDMERGDGLKISRKYNITSYPTFMFFNPEGEYVYIAIGYRKPDGFMEELKNSMDKSKQFSSAGFSASIDLEYPQFYMDAFGLNGKRKFPKTEEVTAYLDGQKDLFSEVNWAVMARFQAGEKYKKVFFDNIAKYTKLYGQASVNGKVKMILYSDLQDAYKNKDESKFNGVLAIVDKYVPKEERAEDKEDFTITYYTQTKDWVRLAKTVDEHIAKDGYKNTEFINSISWNLYESCDDQASLKKATGWMEKVVAQEPTYALMDTYAALLYKTNQLKDAETWANKAIAAGEKSGDKTDSTKELLEKIKKAN